VDVPGPVVVVHVYEDAQLDGVLQGLAITDLAYSAASVFARPRDAVARMTQALLPSCRTVVVQDSPATAALTDTGVIRALLTSWSHARTIRETFDPPMHFAMPHMQKP